MTREQATAMRVVQKANRLRAVITENVRAEAAGEIDWDTFRVRQIAAWDAIRAAGHAVEGAVLRAMRTR